MCVCVCVCVCVCLCVCVSVCGWDVCLCERGGNVCFEWTNTMKYSLYLLPGKNKLLMSYVIGIFVIKCVYVHRMSSCSIKPRKLVGWFRCWRVWWTKTKLMLCSAHLMPSQTSSPSGHSSETNFPARRKVHHTFFYCVWRFGYHLTRIWQGLKIVFVLQAVFLISDFKMWIYISVMYAHL